MEVRNHLLLTPWRLTLVDTSYIVAPPLVHLLLHSLYVLGTSARCVWPSEHCLPFVRRRASLDTTPPPVVDLTLDEDDSMCVPDLAPVMATPFIQPVPLGPVLSSPSPSTVAPTSSEPHSSILVLSNSTSLSHSSSPSSHAQPLPVTPSSPSPYGRAMCYPPGPPPPPTVSPPPRSVSTCSIDLNSIYLNLYSPPMHERPSPPRSLLHTPDWQSPYEPPPSVSPFSPIDIDGWASPSMYPLDPYVDWTPDRADF